MEGSTRPSIAIAATEIHAALSPLVSELQQQLEIPNGRMRHAFLLLHNEDMPPEPHRLIDVTLGSFLGADKYESFFLGPRLYPLRRNPRAELWHLFLANNGLSDTAKDRWCSTWTELDRLSKQWALSAILPEVSSEDGWLLFLYRLSLRHPELRRWGEPWCRSFPQAGSILTVGGEEVFNDWLASKDFRLTDWLRGEVCDKDFDDWLRSFFVGERIVMLPDDIRLCSLRAIQALLSRALPAVSAVERRAEVTSAAPETVGPVDDPKPANRKRNRNTERGEGQAKLTAFLTKHHRYAEGSCLNLGPIGNNELANLAGVDKSTASAFFKSKFDGHAKYKAICRDAHMLAASLKALNGEFRPRDFYLARMPDEVEQPDE